MAETRRAIVLSQQESCEEEEVEKAMEMMNTNGGGGGGVGSSSSDHQGARKARGRPPGSKNKPKPPIIITKESDEAMKTSVLEVPSGSDVVEMLFHFSCQRNVGVCILSASGSVSNVTLRHPTSPNANATLFLPGCFQILSLSGSFLPACSSSSSSSSTATTNSLPLTISVAGSQLGQIIGGTVAGKLIGLTPILLVVATFVRPCFHRLPISVCEEEEAVAAPTSPGNDIMSISGYNPSPSPLNCQIPSDVLSWAPNSRNPPPY